MMHRVGVAPEVVRRECQHAEHAPDPVVEPAAAEKRAMAAVMLDHEQAHQETGRRYGEQQADPVTEVKAEPRRGPQHGEWSKRDKNLNEAAPGIWAAVARKDFRPARRVVCCRSRSRAIVHRHIRLIPSAARWRLASTS